ncbi:L-aspartate oxidase [Desulforhopalus singaporensis]|uniref:L-aspartate oxidase n=1 Tax=Desulforhopalus singaporensis TaxID=91360 RepID=A0A1H0U1I4_9BACT|nr:L-aspartate oxidase [Desulforhopalus singaporensis]SDP60039.1 L-aspartate oxidase [Desulforhopalus singaporensis]
MRHFYDVVIVGSGVAGLSAGILLKEYGLNVVVITKESRIQETATNYAQGGIIAWKKSDSPELLEKDIIHAGCDVNSSEAVRLIVEKGPKLVFDFLIDRLGMDFSRSSGGELDYTEEAAHSTRRIIHYSDHTGEHIQKGLIEYARKIGLPILPSRTAIDLITNNHHSEDTQELYAPSEVMGLYVLNNEKEVVETFLAHNVILATGGLGNIYQHTTNPLLATGDGMSMAYRAGADIINGEYVQFHPTALYHRDIKRFLISESLRGEGAILIDHGGRPFMKSYSDLADLAPRDVVARAIYEEMAKSGKDFMFLDIASHYKGREPLEQRFSRIYQTCLKGGIDITREPIPVVPAAHYFCGGIKVDRFGRSSIANLYAIGETSCTGVHGANRLASTSLLEGLTWAKQAADHIRSEGEKISLKRFARIPDWHDPEYSEEFDPLLFQQDWKMIQLTMWNYAGISRTRKGLDRARSDLNYHAHRILKFYREAKLNRQIIELRNGVVNATIIARAAARNKNSKGCHFMTGR